MTVAFMPGSQSWARRVLCRWLCLGKAKLCFMPRIIYSDSGVVDRRSSAQNPLKTGLAAQLQECAQQISQSCQLLQGQPQRLRATSLKAMPCLEQSTCSDSKRRSKPVATFDGRGIL